tara:strand:+ start:3409 stop:4890 length:1482 start_codon:yes stop_codon:yes gene_type:complete
VATPDLSKNHKTMNFINGEYCVGRSGNSFTNISPVDGSIISVVNEASQADVDAAVKAAKNALNGPWGTMPLAERLKLVTAIVGGIQNRFDEFLEAEVADTGKPVSLASHLDIPRGAANFEIFADIMRNHHNECFRMPTPDGTGALNYTVSKPKGVIGIICPWNLPLLLMTWKAGPALACGNTVVVKPSEETPSTAALLGEVMNDVGVPNGVYNVVQGTGPGSTGEILTKHPDVDAITFTGETRTGEIILKNAAVGVRDVSFELGGKNPAIIFADCDMDKAIEGTMRSAFANCGQVCLGTERVYVERPIFDEFVNLLKEGAESLVCGHPKNEETSLGPLISKEHQQKVLNYYKIAESEGAKVITGGKIPEMEELNDGAWIEPTIWTGLDENSVVVKEEIFGPCCHISPFDNEDEVIAMANNTPYGLACSIWTEDLARAHRVAPQMEVGICWINSWFLRDLRTPFGGSKQSGIGREGGIYSLEFYTETSNICVKL